MSAPATPGVRDGVVYQIYVRSFADANNDGLGDLRGITERLDNLAALAVDAIWLTPFFPSPQHDHGYDVADYTDVDPMYGTLADIDALIAGCHKRDVRVLLDIVPNHCSVEHRWFRDALAARGGSRERSRFYFRDGRGEHGELPPNNWWAVFGGPAWTRVADGQWYLHTFTPWQPDWDWDCPDVVEHFDRALRFWFDRGADGFRVDAVTHVGKAPGLPDAPPLPAGTRDTDRAAHNPHAMYWPSGHDVWRHWRALTDSYEREHPGRTLSLVAEAYTARRPEVLRDYVRPDEFHQAFSFDLMLSPWNAELLRTAIGQTIAALESVGASPTWTLNNHDVQRSVTRYGRSDATDPASWTGSNLVYHDVPVDLAVGTRRARAAAVLVAGLPGALYVYQGEELGLPEVLDLPDAARTDPIYASTRGREIGRDGCRVPLPWTRDATTSAGFSDGPAPVAAPWLPQPDGWTDRAVTAQAEDPESMLSLYWTLLAARRRARSGGAASQTVLTWALADEPHVVAFECAGLLVVLNPTGDDIDISASVASTTRVIVSSRTGHTSATLIPADTCAWLGAAG